MKISRLLILVLMLLVFSLISPFQAENALAIQGAAQTANFNPDPSLVSWLEDKAHRLVSESRSMTTSSDVTPYYPPAGKHPPNPGYLNAFIGDFSLLAVDSHLVPIEDMKEYIRWHLRRQRDDGRIAHYITPDGDDITWGYNDSGDDLPMWSVYLVYYVTQQEGNLDFFHEMQDELQAGMDWVTIRNGVVFNPRSHSGHTWLDVYDMPQAKLFWCSVMYWKASHQMAEMYDAIGKHGEAEDFRNRARLIRENIEYFYDSNEGVWIASSTHHVHFVVANAFAVWVGFTTEEETHRISQWLVSNYDRIVKNGWVRHLPYPEYWTSDGSYGGHSPDKYANGGYWYLWSGWVAYAISQSDVALAESMVEDGIREMQTNGVAECRHADWSSRGLDFITGFGPPLAAIYRMQGESNKLEAVISAQPTSGAPPLNVSFNGSASHAPEGDIVSYDWDFGDGATASGVTASHTYAATGHYTASLTVKDNAGNQDIASVTITVDGQAPSTPQNLSATPTSAWGVNLSWNASTDDLGVAGYNIYRNGVAIANTSTTLYPDSGLTPQTTYAYQVSAYDACGNESALSSPIQVTTPEMPPSLFFDDFSDGEDSNPPWSRMSGSWSVVNGEYHQSQALDNAFALAGDVSWSDYAVQMRVKLASASRDGGTGPMFRCVDSSNCMQLELKAGSNQIKLWKIVNGSFSTIATATLPFSIQADTWYSIRVESQGDQFRGFIDGVQYVEATDTSLPAGAIGCNAGDAAWFDDVLVTPVGLRGDVNNDGVVDSLDIQLCSEVILGFETRVEIKSRADVNGDGFINSLDTQEIGNIIIGK